MYMGFATTWLRQVSPLLHKTTLTTAYGGKRSHDDVDFAFARFVAAAIRTIERRVPDAVFFLRHVFDFASRRVM